MDGKFLSKVTKALIVSFLLGLFIKKIPWYLRKIVKVVVPIVINVIDKYADKVIPDKIDPLINMAITAIDKGDYDKAGQATGVALDMLVEIQNVSGIKKRNAFVTGAQLLFDLIDEKIKLKK